MRAALYTRISSDPSGQRAGVQRQADECHTMIEGLGWELAATFEDNDRSAYSGKLRPGYEALLDAVQAGEIDAIVAWHPDRLHRSPRELERFIDIVEASGATIATVQGGNYDLSTAAGRMTARVVGAVARHESEHKSERHRAKARELAKEGKVAGGGTRPFGFEADRVTIREAEAVEIRSAVAAILDGATVHAVLVDWRRRNVLGPTGKPWQRTPVQRMLSSPRIAGLRQYRGEIVGPAEWPGIITETQHRRVVAVLDDRRHHHRRPSRRYLLTNGIAVCGLCGHQLVARPRGDGARSICCPGGTVGGCGKIRALADPLENHVRDQVFEALASPALLTAIDEGTAEVDGDALVTELRHAEAALDQAATDHYADRLIGRSEFLAARDALERRIDDLKAELGAAARPVVLDDLEGAAGELLAAAWSDGDIEWRQQLLAAVIERIIVHPAVRGRNFFDPTRVTIHWRVG